MLETLIDTPIDAKDAIIFGALAIILLLLLGITSKLRRIMRLIEPKREPTPAGPDGQPQASGNRYMREETLAEFLQRQREGN